MSGAKDNPRTEDFKRATTGALRAIAHSNDVQVAFQPGPSGLTGARARLPLPTRTLPPAEMARLRGIADSLALRVRYHNDAIHAARSPAPREARDAFDALEQTRVEVVGAAHMAGVAANLRAHLAEQCEVEGYDRMTRKDLLPVAAALSLLARERMSGQASPPAAQRVLDLWRDTLGPAADAALTEMAQAQADQTQFSRAARKLLAALDLAEAEVEAEPEDNTEADAGAEEQGPQDASQDAEGESSADSDSMMGAEPEQMEGEAASEDDSDTAEDDAAAQAEDRPGGPQPHRDRPGTDNEHHYRAYTRAHDEEIGAEDLVDAEEL